MAKTRKAEPKTQEASNQAADVDRLASMKIGDLQLLFAEVVGEKTRCPNRAWLVKKIVEAAVPARASDSTEPEEMGLRTEKDATTRQLAAPVALGVSEADPDTREEAPIAPGQAAAIVPAAASEVADTSTKATEIKLSKLDVTALQARYREVLGRDTSSDNRNYLVWKIREAEKGRVPTGPRRSGRAEGATFKVLPLRMESDLVDQLDEAWRRQGLATRMELFRVALRTYLASVGENDVAELLKVRDA